MKIFISADIEGIAGVMRPEQCSPGHAEHQLARGLMEQEVNAAAAEQGTPLWLVSGDDQLQGWITEHYPSVDYVCVKRAISHTCAESISPQAAQNAIRAAATAAVQRARQVSTTRLTAPYEMQLQASKPVLADLFSLIPGVTRIDAVTVGYRAEQMGTLISLLSAFSYLASTQS